MTRDLTQGSPIKVLLAFSTPMLIGNLVQQFYNMVDLMIVGRFVGVNALAAVGATSTTMMFVFSLVAGLTNGASVVVSQYYGYGDEEKTRQTVATSVYMLSAAAIFLTIFGAVITRPMLQLINTPPEILDGAVTYLRVIFLGVIGTVGYNSTANILRALGNSLTPLIFLTGAVILNIFLDLLFVVTFGMGIAGAAWATVAAQAFAAVGCITYAARKMPILRLHRRHFILDKTILAQTVKLGIPGGITNSVISLGGLTVQSVINSYGAQVVAAYSAAHKIDQLAIQPMMSLGMGTATFAAQNMGAGKIDRVRKGFWSAIAISAVFCAFMSPLMFLLGGKIMTLFVESSEAVVLAVGGQYLRIVSVFFFLIAVIVLLENFLRGTGDVFTPLFSNVVELTVRIAAAYALSSAFGYTGIWWSGPVAWLAGTTVCAIRYASGKWQFKALIFRDSTQETQTSDSNG